MYKSELFRVFCHKQTFEKTKIFESNLEFSAIDSNSDVQLDTYSESLNKQTTPKSKLFESQFNSYNL